MTNRTINFTLNGETVSAAVEPHHNLDGSWTFEAVWQAWHNAARREQEGAATIDNGRTLLSTVTPDMNEEQKLAAAYTELAAMTDQFQGAQNV